MVSFPEYPHHKVMTRYPEWYHEEMNNREWALWCEEQDDTGYSFFQSIIVCLRDHMRDIYDIMVEELSAQGDFSIAKCYLWLYDSIYFVYVVGIFRDYVRDELQVLEYDLESLWDGI